MKKITIFFLLISIPYRFYSQTKIKGFVSDETGPLPGANILIKNSDTGVISDIDGYYEIEAKASDTLSISYLGYNTKDVLVDNQKNINTVLEGIIALDEVVIIGYGISKRTFTTRCYTHSVQCEIHYNKESELKSVDFKSDLITPSLYPNPSKDGQFQLKLLDSYKNIQIQVANIAGQIIKRNQHQNITNQVSIDLSGYPTGIYIINIIADGKPITTKKAIVGK